MELEVGGSETTAGDEAATAGEGEAEELIVKCIKLVLEAFQFLRPTNVVIHGHFGVQGVVFPAKKLLQSYCDI